MDQLQPITFPGIDPQKPLVIAGPCSAETLEQTLQTAKELSETGIKIFRAGIWKPRTKPGGFEGVGSEGLEWLNEVKKQYGMLTATDSTQKKPYRPASTFSGSAHVHRPTRLQCRR